jgi:hypothetical protein
MAKYKLFCFLVGGNGVFLVNIDKTETVGDLKKEIKKEKPADLRDIDADKLTLFEAEVEVKGPYTRQQRTEILNHLNQLSQNLTPDNALLEEMLLSEIHCEPSPGKKHYIIVQAPKGQ